MTKRRVYSGSNTNHNNNRRHGGHNNKKPNVAGENTSAVPNNNSGGNPNNHRPRNNENNQQQNRPVQSILPSPSVLQEYEYATDGAASRIIAMAEIEQDRRNEWEAEYIRFYKKSLRIGQLFGFAILGFVVYAVIYLAEQGKDDVAEVLAVSAFLSVAVASIFGRGSARKNSRRMRRERPRRHDRHRHGR